MRPASGRPSLAAMSCTRAWASWHVARTMRDRKSTRLNSSHLGISYAVFCLKKKKKQKNHRNLHKGNKKEAKRKPPDLHPTQNTPAQDIILVTSTEPKYSHNHHRYHRRTTPY